MKRHITGHCDNGIILEGQRVFLQLDNVALAAAMLFGLMYALNLDYPKELKYTFNVLQKIVMKLEVTTMYKNASSAKTDFMMTFERFFFQLHCCEFCYCVIISVFLCNQ